MMKQDNITIEAGKDISINDTEEDGTVNFVRIKLPDETSAADMTMLAETLKSSHIIMGRQTSERHRFWIRCEALVATIGLLIIGILIGLKF